MGLTLIARLTSLITWISEQDKLFKNFRQGSFLLDKR